MNPVPLFQKRHLQEIAETLKSLRPTSANITMSPAQWNLMVKAFVWRIERHNPNFELMSFVTACGGYFEFTACGGYFG